MKLKYKTLYMMKLMCTTNDAGENLLGPRSSKHEDRKTVGWAIKYAHLEKGTVLFIYWIE